ncbi:MAG: YkgJ family cysteine cluster protein [Candidatus Bathyarchaeota archaeon]|nr:YkgJ family cysteine cluster protein [Candidatus Bathyarchaeota archaeon]
MSDDLNGKTYSFDVCAICKSICCRDANPPLTEERKKIIRNYLLEKKYPTESLFVEGDYAHPASDEKGHCIFLDKNTKKCLVHQVKPETCKAGPITFDINRQTGKLEFYLKKSEICPFAQIIYEDKIRLKEHLEAAKAEIFRLVNNLEAEALQAILRIEEPHTFKIFEEPLPENVLNKINFK